MTLYLLQAFKRSLYGILGCILTAAVFSGCSSCGLKGTCCNFGRPDVLAYKTKYIIDYNDCFEECNLCGAECLKGIQKQAITAEMLDPFQPVDPNYRLAKGDILEISVFGEEDASVSSAMIAPDGKLYYTVLDGIPAAGRNPNELAKDIQDQLGHLFLNPIVSVSPKQTLSLNYCVMGRVRASGEFPFLGPVTLREAIAESGGLLTQTTKEQDFARRYMIPNVDLNRSFLVRDSHKLNVDFGKLLGEGDDSQNIYLKPGDYIYIAPAENKDIFVLGYVNAPQRTPFIPGMTLMSTLAVAGGWPTPNPYSPNLEKILVIRGSLECPKVCCVDVKKILCGHARDVYLQPGDIVYASHKQFRFGREMVLLAVDSFISNFVGGAADYYAEFEWFKEDDDEE